MAVMSCYPPPPIASTQPKAVSLGVSHYSPWDLEMANKGYKVLQYDASIDQSPDIHQNIIFHKKFVGIKQDSKTITLEQIISDYKFDENAHNILQIDIENAEWAILEKIDFSLLARYFAQIILEFHECDPRDSLKTAYHTQILEKFRKEYQPIHLHYNLYGPIYYVEDRFFSSLLEISYARKDIVPKDSKLRDVCGNIPNLDYPNNEKFPELPIDF